MDTINTLLVVTLIVNAIQGLLILFADVKNRTSQIYSFSVLSVLAWTWSMIFFRISDQSNILIWTKILYITASLIASNFLSFTYLFPNHDKALTRAKSFFLFGINLLLILLICFSDLIISSAQVNNSGENTIIFGPLYFLYVIYILFFFLYSFYRLYKKYSSSIEKLEKGQSLYLFIGYSIAGNISFITNLILPWIGIYSFNWMGQISTIFMVLFAAYAIFKHQLFNVKVIATELFIGGLWIFVLLRVILAKSIEEKLSNGALLITTIIIGYFLVKSVIKEVESREKIEVLAKDLEKANVRLKELDQQKSEFVSLASHQLRGPLTAIKGYASLLLEGDFGTLTTEVKDAVDKIYKSSNALAVLVGDYLDVSRIEQGRMKYDFSIFNLKELVASIISELKPSIESAKLEFTYDFNNNDTYIINADQGKIKQVISNIIDNSIKYTPKGWIHVKIEKNKLKKKLTVTIKDSGVGIRAEVLPNLFEKFTRAPDASKTNIMGTGLGLYVAKKIIEAHKGRIWAESPGENKGSSFIIELDSE
jgi:signal transduction histidine kinase